MNKEIHIYIEEHKLKMEKERQIISEKDNIGKLYSSYPWLSQFIPKIESYRVIDLQENPDGVEYVREFGIMFRFLEILSEVQNSSKYIEKLLVSLLNKRDETETFNGLNMHTLEMGEKRNIRNCLTNILQNNSSESVLKECLEIPIVYIYIYIYRN